MADISMRQMAQTLATIDERTTKMDHKLDGLFDRFDDNDARIIGLARSTARLPSGRSLVSAVDLILRGFVKEDS
jgi:hypothetical protein